MASETPGKEQKELHPEAASHEADLGQVTTFPSFRFPQEQSEEGLWAQGLSFVHFLALPAQAPSVSPQVYLSPQSSGGVLSKPAAWRGEEGTWLTSKKALTDSARHGARRSPLLWGRVLLGRSEKWASTRKHPALLHSKGYGPPSPRGLP